MHEDSEGRRGCVEEEVLTKYERLVEWLIFNLRIILYTSKQFDKYAEEEMRKTKRMMEEALQMMRRQSEINDVARQVVDITFSEALNDD